MLVANSFDLWQKDDFFPAAEEVQQSADIMESMYRMWVRGRREGQQLEFSHELRRELQIALATAKWQLDEFERALRFSHGFRSQDNTTTRHKQFVHVMEHQISRVETDLRESLAEEKQPLRWVNLDAQESDDLEAFLSGTSATLQTNQGSVELEPPPPPKVNSQFPDDQLRRKDVINLDYDTTRTGDRRSDCMTSYKEVVTINKDSKYVLELQANEIPRTCDVTNCQADKLVNPQPRTWSSPNFGSWKIVIADDEGEQKKTLEMSVKSTTKGKASTSTFWRQKGGALLQTKGVISNCLDLRANNRFTKLFKQLTSAQRQLQGPQYIQFNRFLQVMLLVMLSVFLVVPMVVYAS